MEHTTCLLYTSSGEDLKESAQAAIDEGNIFDFEDLSLETSDRSLAKEYEKLFTAGSVYEIAPTYDMDDEECADGAELRLFVRVDDAYEGYQLTGDEDIIFLYVNDSTSRVTFRSFIDGYYTKKVTVKGNSSLFETTVHGTQGSSNGGVAGDAQVPEGNGGNPGEVTEPDSNVAGDAVQNPDSNADSDGNVTNPDDSVDNNVQNPEENNDADENGANSEENKGDEIQNQTGNSGSDENITRCV